MAKWTKPADIKRVRKARAKLDAKRKAAKVLPPISVIEIELPKLDVPAEVPRETPEPKVKRKRKSTTKKRKGNKKR